MSRSQPVSATIFAELMIELAGVYSPYQRSPNPLEEPDDPACVEDVAVTGLTYETTVWAGGPTRMARVGKTINLLDGCDLKSPDMIRFLDNLARALHDEAVEALMEDAE